MMPLHVGALDPSEKAAAKERMASFLTFPDPRQDGCLRWRCWRADHETRRSVAVRARTPLALYWATAALASKGLGAASLLIVACDTLKDRARSACTAPSESLWMTSSWAALRHGRSRRARSSRQRPVSVSRASNLGRHQSTLHSTNACANSDISRAKISSWIF